MLKLKLKILIARLVKAWKTGDRIKEYNIINKLDNIFIFNCDDLSIMFYGTSDQVINLLKMKGGLK